MFILCKAARVGRIGAKSTVNAMRAFLRFLAAHGHCPADLIAAVPTIAEWKLSSLPRYLSASAVDQLVAACHPATATGSRDRAVILLLARLGLRASDVRHLRLADIEAPSMGAHVLRHSAATEMLRQGLSLDSIGAVLRHCCVQTTAHYAKVGVAMLRGVAQPWPADGGSPC